MDKAEPTLDPVFGLREDVVFENVFWNGEDATDDVLDPVPGLDGVFSCRKIIIEREYNALYHEQADLRSESLAESRD
jgi:hypothetical protein